MHRCRLAYLTATAVLIVPVSSYIYHLEYDVSVDGQNVVILSEGPMFASGDGPFGTAGDSTIRVVMSGKGRTSSSTGPPNADTLNFHVTFVDSVTSSFLGPTTIDGSTSFLEKPLCCSPSLYTAGACGPNVSVGGLIINNDNNNNNNNNDNNDNSSSPLAPPVYSWSATSVASFQGNANYKVIREGGQNAVLVTCDARGMYTLPPFDISLDISFENPYGYVPGVMYGLLPFDGTLFVLYLLVVLLYSVLMCKQRRHLISLQYGVASLLFLGLLEMAVWFFTFDSKNKSGIPIPCAVCPTTSDYMTAVVLNVMKRAVSRVLLLAVALGYGVVHESLDRRKTFAILALGASYFIAATLDEVEKETSYSTGPSVWEFPVFVLDLVFFIWIYRALLAIQVDLTTGGQAEKLRMYKQLMKVIMVNAAAWLIISFIIASIELGWMPLSWKSRFFLVKFWDICYFAVLCAVAYIWAPGPTAYQYSLYSQPPGTESDIDGNNDNNNGGGGGGSEDGSGNQFQQNGRTVGVNVDDDEEEEDEFRIGGGKSVQKKNTNTRIDPASIGIEMTSAVSASSSSSSTKTTTSSSNGGAATAGAGKATSSFAIVEEDDDDGEDAEHDQVQLAVAGGKYNNNKQQQKKGFDTRSINTSASTGSSKPTTISASAGESV